MSRSAPKSRVPGLDFHVSLDEVMDLGRGQEVGPFLVPKGAKATMRTKIVDGDKNLVIRLEEGSTLNLISETSGNSSLTIECTLSGPDSNVVITNFCRAIKSDSQKSVTNVIHSATNTRSLVKSRGAAWDSSSIELSGLARIEKSAPGSVSRVECKALVLGDKAKARADPLLEIMNNDVDCSHAASVKEIEKEKIFYLQARGLNELAARQIIADGFLGEME